MTGGLRSVAIDATGTGGHTTGIGYDSVAAARALLLVNGRAYPSCGCTRWRVPPPGASTQTCIRGGPRGRARRSTACRHWPCAPATARMRRWMSSTPPKRC